MALILGMYAYNSIFVGDNRYLVTKIHDHESVRLSGMNKDFELNMDEDVEIEPRVFVKVGFDTDVISMFTRLLFTAPYEIDIVRSKIYWEKHKNREVEVRG